MADVHASGKRENGTLWTVCDRIVLAPPDWLGSVSAADVRLGWDGVNCPVCLLKMPVRQEEPQNRSRPCEGEAVAGYVLLNVEITDQAAFDEVLKKAPSVVEEYSGKRLIRGGTVKLLFERHPHHDSVC